MSKQTSLTQAIAHRRTFAIISHPDAGKTTLTEKLLLYGGAIRLAGTVKGRKAKRHATADWMELEKQRGITITSTVLQFAYAGYHLNLLDTPGHQDFSEDTYRTLTAADSAVMLIDAVKGVEAQTIKLFKVCRLRGIPIFTFINKLDRHGRDPFDLMAEIEQVLGIRSYPMNWPIGMGNRFRGVYDRRQSQVELFESRGHGEGIVPTELHAAKDPALLPVLGADLYDQLLDEIALLDAAGDEFDRAQVLRGELTPLFFGSALTNFGVGSFLQHFLELAPPPGPRPTTTGVVQPDGPEFSAFVFKIQANMNPAHRDRVAFLRICSGRFERSMSVQHVRTGKEVRLAQPQQFLGQERSAVEEAYAGDIIGVHDPGIYRIADTVCAGNLVTFAEIPRFTPEHFATVRLKDAMKQKHLKKGLDQLSQEGAVQVFYPPEGRAGDLVLGAVGLLQFDVLAYRLEHEYGVRAQLSLLPFQIARWPRGADWQPHVLEQNGCRYLQDQDAQPVVLFSSEWSLNWAAERFPAVRFCEITE